MRSSRRVTPYSKIFRKLIPIPEDTIMPNENIQTNPSSYPQLATNMPQHNHIFDSLKIPDAIKDLPKFDGNPRLLYEFLNNVEEILGYLADVDGTNYAKILLRAIRNKIVGPANEVLNVYGTPLIWENIKANLVLHYSDKRNETSLIRDLHNLKQVNQTVESFYGSIIEIQAAINNNILIHETNHSVIEAKQKLFAEMCLNTFLTGLKEPLGSNIRSMRPKSLAEALSFCIQEQNIYYNKKSTYTPGNYNDKFIRSSNQPRNSYQQTVRPIQQYRPFLQQPHQFVSNYTNSNQFPVNGNNNYRSNQQFGQKIFSTNRNNNFNSNFAGQQRTQRLPPPEPMDVSSGYTHLRRPQSGQTRRTGNTFRPQEMHNINSDFQDNIPQTSLDEFYYYDQNPVYNQDSLERMNNNTEFVDRYHGSFSQTVNRDTNEIDETENFRSKASRNPQDT